MSDRTTEGRSMVELLAAWDALGPDNWRKSVYFKPRHTTSFAEVLTARAKLVEKIIDEARRLPGEPPEQHEVLIGRLRAAAEAYPVDMFSEVTPAERIWLHKDHPGLQDRIAASMGRHMSTILTAAADALEGSPSTKAGDV